MNPMMAIMQMMRGGGNPQTMLQQLMGNTQINSNPMAMNAVKMFQKGDMSGLQAMAENLAKERGTTVNDVKNQIMGQFGMR